MNSNEANSIAKIKCKNNNIHFFHYVGAFANMYLRQYYETKKNIEYVKSLELNKLTYDETYKLKDIFQNDYKFGIPRAMLKLDVKFNNLKKNCFEWLDKVDEPYFFIYNPLYFYNTYNNKYGLYQEEETGITKGNHEIAKDYALYKLNKTKLNEKIISNQYPHLNFIL